MPQLHVLPGDGTERVVDLGERPVSFGRADGNDVVMTEPKASRNHCTFRQVRGGWRVRDEQSTNGTWLGGRPVLSARLQPGDAIEIGDTVITFVAQPSEMPKPDLARPRRARKVHMPWEGLVAAAALALVAWFGTGSMAAEHRTRETLAWKRKATAEISRAALARDEASYRSSLQSLVTELRGRERAADAVTVLQGAISQGLPPAEAPRRPDWAVALESIEASRARTSAAERRAKLRDLLGRYPSSAAAIAGVTAVLRADDATARERAAAESARLLADAEKAAAESRWSAAVDDLVAWRAAAPDAPAEAERDVAKRLAEVRAKARDDAGAALAQYEGHMREARLAAATGVVDQAAARLRGTGWDAWLLARTRRSVGGEGGPGGPTPTATGPRESDAARAKRLAREKLDRALRTSGALASKRRFADAAVALTEAAAEVDDAGLKADLATRAEDMTAASEALRTLLEQVRDDPPHFAVAVPVAGGTGKVAGAQDGALLVGDAKGANPRPVALGDLPGGAFPPLFDKAKIEPEAVVSVAVLLHEVGEADAYAVWMLKALANEPARLSASAVHARMAGEAMPDGGYCAHPENPKLIVPWDVRKAVLNKAKIAELSAQMQKCVEKIDASKQAKQIEAVAQAYARLEAARKTALELIFDEVRYFYPYRTRMKEYVPVQRDVDERVKKVEEAWADPASAKVRTDASLEKLLKQADDLAVEIGFLGGDATPAVERVERMRTYLGKELTVQTFFVTREDLALLEYNREMMAANAKVRGDIDESEREQVRITNEYRRLMGHRRVLRLHEKLVAAARGHSDDMARLGFFDHFSPVEGKKSPMDRMLLAGYPNSPCSENIHAGSGDPQGAHNGWIHSSGHHRNILMPNWSEMGTGRSGKHWTQNFGFASGDEQAGGPGPQ